uniref:Ankyrin repeat domain-containing protein n=1 Tax=Pyramimonas obovata TaxID=1411642 RepID=A0A7S0MQL8_9CHLO|mmetsp:Transcript_11159/g.23279  ORF Transcript_11159/g.23279 Transcript_11159/m.23279 type:complete len:143 (+) Transcript_11159:80-508(+)|eukprot:CAMPEP_0118932878 /NCGR_PEP_ID=MMETSP1169-20130426/10668_1 /TAXON_ID=36882 /ORGANISM="Pyramimonas obovata, Strain CCMP722" /LENGTH=142 /DNA_ID=CAMNT_0006875583 /DNA_START=54 /DNA_END=482 /DNA_ORIENTATION=-
MGFVDDARDGNFDAVREALAKGVDVNQKDELGYTALMCAAGQGQYEICQTLFDAGADPFVFCQAIGKKGFVAMDFALAAQDETVTKVSNTEYAKIIKLLSPPEAEEDELRGAEELDERLKNQKLVGSLCAGAQIKTTRPDFH